MFIQRGTPKNTATRNIPVNVSKIHSVERIIRNTRNAHNIPITKKNPLPKLNQEYRNRPLETSIPSPTHIPYHEIPNPTNKKITINAAQGLGDILWAYQKLSPYFEEVNINILTCGDDEVQHRCNDWMKIFPKTKTFKFLNVPHQHYHKVAQEFPNIKNLMTQWEQNKIPDYCPNRWMEIGTRIEAIDPGSSLERTIPLITQPTSTPFKDYIAIAISGGTDSYGNQNNPLLQVWSVDKWLFYIQNLYKKYKLNTPAIILGANFDKETCNKISQGLKQTGIQNEQIINQPPLAVTHILKNAKFLIGYQSGLSIVSENFDVPQIMMYFAYLHPMLYTWCKPTSIRTIFHANTFNKPPEQVLEENDLTHALSKITNKIPSII